MPETRSSPAEPLAGWNAQSWFEPSLQAQRSSGLPGVESWLGMSTHVPDAVCTRGPAAPESMPAGTVKSCDAGDDAGGRQACGGGGGGGASDCRHRQWGDLLSPPYLNLEARGARVGVRAGDRQAQARGLQGQLVLVRAAARTAPGGRMERGKGQGVEWSYSRMERAPHLCASHSRPGVAWQGVMVTLPPAATGRGHGGGGGGGPTCEVGGGW